MSGVLSRIKASPNYKWWAVSAMAMSVLMTVADFTSVGIAMPTISDEFDSDLPTVQWLAAGQLVAISAVLLPLGRLSDMIGRKKVYLWGLVIFVLCAGLASASPNLGVLILLRVLQGLGLGMVFSNQVAIMASVFPQRERGKILGVHITLVGLGTVIGPALGGLLVDVFGWRSVFLINVPWGLMAILPCLLVLDESRLRQASPGSLGGRFDLVGAVLSTVALLAFILAVTNGQRLGWDSPLIVTALIGCLVLLGAFIRWELRSPSPMLDLTLFKNRVFSMGVAARYISFLTVASSVFLIPFYLQGVAGYSPTKSGLIVTTMPMGMVALGSIGGHLSDKFGWRPFNVAGAAIAAMGFLLFFRASEDTPLALIILALFLQGGGAGMFNAANSSSVLGAVERARYGIASALLDLMRNSANVTGIAVGTVIVTGAMASRGFEPSLGVVTDDTDPGLAQAFTSGFRTVFIVLAGLRVLAAIVSYVQGDGTSVAVDRDEVMPPESRSASD